jgi:hypothetical protein
MEVRWILFGKVTPLIVIGENSFSYSTALILLEISEKEISDYNDYETITAIRRLSC